MIVLVIWCQSYGVAPVALFIALIDEAAACAEFCFVRIYALLERLGGCFVNKKLIPKMPG